MIKSESDDESSDNDIDRNANASPLIKPSNKWANKNKYKPRMTDIVEETEPESSFKDTTKNPKKKPILNVPEPIAEDRDDDFSDDSDEAPKEAKNELKDFTFIPGKKLDDNKGHTFLAKSQNSGDVDMSKLSSVERIREYLENEMGGDLLFKVYPIIKEFGDDILFMDKMQDLKAKLKHLMSGSEVDKLHIYFSTLVFYELKMEKSHKTKKVESE